MNTQMNDTEGLTITCLRCGAESPFVAGQIYCPQCGNAWYNRNTGYPDSSGKTCCKNCGGDFSCAESPLCPSCGLHVQDLICRECGESYRMDFSTRSEYPCPSCGRENLERDFIIMNTSTFFEETAYATPYAVSEYPLDEITSPRLLELFPSTNAPFERKMPFGKRENRVDLNPALIGKGNVRSNEDKEYRINAVSLLCNTMELPQGAGIRLTIRDRRSCKVVQQEITPERAAGCKCLFLFDKPMTFYSCDLTFTLEVRKNGTVLPMDIAVRRAYSSSWVQWKDAAGCLFSPALKIYGDYYNRDTGESIPVSTEFSYDSVDVTDYPVIPSDYPEEAPLILMELAPDYDRGHVTITSENYEHFISLQALAPSSEYPTVLTGISFVCDTREMPEDSVMRLQILHTDYVHMDMSIIPPREEKAICRFFFEPQMVYLSEIYISLAYEWLGSVRSTDISLVPSSCCTTLAQWKSKAGWHFSPAMTLYGYVQDPETGEKITPLKNYPLFEPEFPEEELPTTNYPTTDYPTTDYPTTDFPATKYETSGNAVLSGDTAGSFVQGGAEAGMKSLKTIPMNVSVASLDEIDSSLTDYPTTAYPSGEDALTGNFNYLGDNITEVTCYNSGDENHGILDFKFDFGTVATQPAQAAQPSGNLALTSQTLDSKFSSPSGLQYRQPSQRRIGGFNSPTGLLKDAHQVCVVTENGYPRFTDFTDDPAGERADRSQTIPEFLRKVTVTSEDGSGLPVGEACFEETLEDGTILRYSMETGAVVAVRQGDSGWQTAEEMKNDLRIIYANESGGFSDLREVAVENDIRQTTPNTSGAIRQIWSRRDGLADIVTLTDTSYRINWYTPEQVTGFSESSGLYGMVTGAVPAKSWTFEATLIDFYTGGDGRIYERETGRVLTEEDLSNLKSLRITERRGSLCFVQEWEQVNPTTMRCTKGEGTEKETIVTTTVATNPVTSEELARGADFLDASFLKVGSVYTHELEMRTTMQGLPGGYRTRHRRYPFGDVCLFEEKGMGTETRESVSFEYELDSTSRNYGCCIRESYSNGKVVEFEYDRSKRLISRKEPWGNGGSQITRYTYCNLQKNDQRMASETKIILENNEEGRIMSRTQYSYGETPALRWQKITKRRRGGSVQPGTMINGEEGEPRPEVTLTEWYGTDVTQNGASSPLAAGRLKRIVGVDGVELQYSYEAGTEPGIACVGTMTQMAAGAVAPGLSTRKVSFYDAWGKVVREREYVHTGADFTMTDEKNYTYDASRRVSRVDYANGRHTESSWICVGPLVETDEHGRKTRYEYNSAKRLKREIQESLSYIPAAGGPVGVTPIPEKVMEYAYDGAGRQIRQTVTQGQKRTQTLTELDALGRSVRETEADGTVKLYSYSSDGLETTVTQPTGAVYTWRDNYDGSQASETGVGLQARYYYQDITEYGIRSEVRVDTPYGPVAETRETDGLGRVLSEGQAQGTSVPKTRIWYSDQGRPIVRKGDGSPSVWMEYDALGNLTHETVCYHLDGSQVTMQTQVSYTCGVLPVDLPSAPAWMTTPLVWKRTIRTVRSMTSTTWELVSRTLAEADRAVVTRDARGRDTMTWQGTTNGKSYEYTLVPESETWDQTVSLNDRTLLVKKRGQGTLTYDYTFLPDGERCVMTDARGNSLTRVTDLMNRTVSETDELGNAIVREYDPETGLLKKITNPLGKTTEYEYDGQGNLCAQFGTAVQPMCFEYDSAGRLVALRTFRVPGEVLTASPRHRTDGDETRWTYDAASGVVLSKTMPDGKKTYRSYNGNGLLQEISGPDDSIQTFRYYEADGLLKYISFNDGTPPVRVLYDGTNRITGIEDASGKHEFGYDAWENVKRETLPWLRSSAITYDWGASGLLSGYRIQTGGELIQQVACGYGEDRKLTSMTLDGEYTYQYSWNPVTGLPEKITWPDGVSRELTYESGRNLVNKLSYGRPGGTPLLSLEKTFDPMARLTTELNSTADGGTRRCSYNDRGEVVSDTRGSGEDWTYSYDNIGNRKVWTHAGEEEKNYLANPLNQYTSITTGNGSAREVFSPLYDDEGNQTLVRTETGDWQITWNAEKRPVCFTRDNERVECVYDYMGRRVRKTLYRDDVPVSRRLFVYNGYRLVAELDDLEESDGRAVSKTWLWDPTGVFDNSPLEMQVWKEEEGYPEVSSSSSEGTTEYPTTAYPEGSSSSSEGTTEYPETEYPQSPFPEEHFFRSADLLMRDRDEWTVTVTTYEDHLELSLDRELFTRGDVCLDRIELVLPDVYPYMESKEIRAIVHLNERVIVKGEWKGEKLHLDLTNSGLSPKRLVPETGEIRIEFQKRKQPGTDEEWEAVAGLAYEGDAKAKPLAHISGAILKRRDSSSSEYATTGYPTTDYPSESSSESSSSEPDSSSSESSSDAVSNGRLGARATPKLARLSVAGLSVSPSSVANRKRYYYLNDGNRNIIALRTPGGKICATYTYGTCGQCLKTTGTVAERNPMRYSSEYYDSELGMIYYNYRHYNPLDGRWLSRDPMEEQDGTNLYGFCSNNPVSRVDQLGLSELPGASSTGFSLNWGNIVRRNSRWAKVCYKYCKKATSDIIWQELADVMRLNFEEKDKWVKGYKPIPEPGDLFEIPNLFVIYAAPRDKLRWQDSIFGTILEKLNFSLGEWSEDNIMSISRKQMDIVQSLFTKRGVVVYRYEDDVSTKLFMSIWTMSGIFGVGFIGHGAWDDERDKWSGYFATGVNDIPVDKGSINMKLKYKLSLVIALSCGALESGWFHLVSKNGLFIGFSGSHKPGDDIVIL